MKRKNNENFDFNFKVAGNIENIKIAYKGKGQIIQVYMSSQPSYSRSNKLSNKSRIIHKSTVVAEVSMIERRSAYKLQILTKFSDTASTVVMELKQSRG